MDKAVIVIIVMGTGLAAWAGYIIWLHCRVLDTRTQLKAALARIDTQRATIRQQGLTIAQLEREANAAKRVKAEAAKAQVPAPPVASPKRKRRKQPLN